MRGTRTFTKKKRRSYAGAEESPSHSAGGVPVEAAAIALLLVFLWK